MKKLVIAAMLFAATTAYAGQEGYIELLRSDVRTKKIAIITQVMQFNDEQSEAFWPIYKEYELALSKVNDQRVALIKDYAKNYETMTDEKAAEIADKWFEFQNRRMSVRKSYFTRFKEALPAATATRFLQLDHQISLLIDLQIASEIPLIEPMSEVEATSDN